MAAAPVPPDAPHPDAPHAHPAAASPWLQRWGHLLPAGGEVLDLACGQGRHLHWLLAHGHTALGVDRDAQALATAPAGAARLQADLEHGPWPLQGRQFSGVLVFNYLWRPRWPALMQCLAPGGVLVYETFATGQETVGRPARAEFLLQPGELLARCQGLRVVAYEDGFCDTPERFVQRIVAVRPPEPAWAGPPRHRLA